MKRLTLSNSRLGLYTECPRCFWLEFNADIKRPDTIFPSLPGGLDLQFKRYFDRFRDRGELPPEVKGKLPGRLLSDARMIDRWRDWRRGIRYVSTWADVELMGALDECLTDEADFYYPLDYKTRGYAPKADSHQYYQNQMNLYTLLLEGNGHKTKRLAYLIYYHPVEVKERGLIQFQVDVHEVPTDPTAAEALVKDAVTALRGPIPAGFASCGFCRWHSAVREWEATPRLNL
ncbi:MAG: PD-(D/E)XK nuclease family protein [Candidatus Methylomirabilis oxyfera]|nr:PD-(D/E)XK nuclease family protein [Candidatus Methylomirabilis oxyfera]